MRIYLSLVLLFFSSSLMAQQLDALQVNFKIKNIGTYAKGKFSEANIEGRFDLKQLDSSYLRAIIQVKSVDTGIAKRDKHLLEPDYFDATSFPEIRFISNRIERHADKRYTVHGTLAIKGKKRKITLDLTLTKESGSALARSEFELRRKDFGVGGKSWILSDKVKAQIQFRIRGK